MTREIKRLARRHPRYGYRRIHAMLVRRGWTVNLKRVRRLWNELGLRRPVRLRKARKLGPKPGASNGRTYGLYSKHLDGFVWVTTPGESSSPTCPGRSGHWAASGVFDEGIAIDFAAHANDRIGPSPRYRSRPW